MIARAKRFLHISYKTASSAMGTPSHAVPRLEQATLRLLRGLLQDSDYAAAQDLWISAVPASLQNPAFRLHLLRRLFARGESLPSSEAREALAPLEVSTLIDAGLLKATGDTVRTLFQIQSYDGLLFIVDFMPGEHPADLVLPIGPSGKYLASLTTRKERQSGLDLGCGCGIQALLMARHVRKVAATDINPRAIALTKLNAALNDVSNIAVLEGSYFEPVNDRQFDLIVANLPYVINPDKRYIYRDLGYSDDSPIRDNVRQIAAHLNEGGQAHVMLNWIHKAQQPWWQPIDSWTTGQNVDAWLIYSSSKTPEEYTGQWIHIDEKQHPDEYARTRKRWLSWYQKHGIERIGFGALNLRRRANADNWRCSIMVSKTQSEPLGEHIDHLFRSQDWLDAHRLPQDLLDMRLRLWNAAIQPSETDLYEVRSLSGLYLRHTIHARTARVVSKLDGNTSARVALQQASLDAADDPQVQEILKELYQVMNLGLIEAVD